MPIRFQVDPDFYDHPKTIRTSDSAISLWVRAGSYSAAKLTDGFVNDNVLVSVLQSSKDVADELVRCGLWKRCRGGYLFHQWGHRNLQKERVEAEREADRKRKYRERKTQRSTNEAPTRERREIGEKSSTQRREIVEAQVNPQSVHRRATPDSTVASAGRPDGSVSVSVSESVSMGGTRSDNASGTARASPPRCQDHALIPLGEPVPPCGACAELRRAQPPPADATDTMAAAARARAQAGNQQIQELSEIEPAPPPDWNQLRTNLHPNSDEEEPF